MAGEAFRAGHIRRRVSTTAHRDRAACVGAQLLETIAPREAPLWIIVRLVHHRRDTRLCVIRARLSHTVLLHTEVPGVVLRAAKAPCRREDPLRHRTEAGLHRACIDRILQATDRRLSQQGVNCEGLHRRSGAPNGVPHQEGALGEVPRLLLRG